MRRLLLLTLIQFLCHRGTAQEIAWPSPEIEQMYVQAKGYLEKGAVDQAAVLLRQAIQLAPSVNVVRRELSQALLIQKSYNEAYEALEPVLTKGAATEKDYQVAGAALRGSGSGKKAKNILRQALSAYPHSGLLYHELGNVQMSEKEPAEALAAWLKGIEQDPGYHLNYYEAAQMYGGLGKPVWTILYGEIFVNMERFTPRSMDMRKLMLEAYRALFKEAIPAQSTDPGHFETAVRNSLLRLSAIMSDGITTENLTMLRTRFIMSWKPKTTNMPFSLFSFHEKMIREGMFDVYNQWLFGRAEQGQQYETWANFHRKEIEAFENWAKFNKVQPTAADFHDDAGNLKKLFKSSKKQSKS